MRRELIVWCVGLVFVASPISLQLSEDGSGLAALAAKGGNGGGGGNGGPGGGNGGGGNGGAGGGNGGNGGGSGQAGGAAKGEAGVSGKDSAPGQNKQDGSSAVGKGKAARAGAVTASSLGKFNGFMHASKTALMQASVNSPLGAIARIYAGQLGELSLRRPGHRDSGAD